MPNIGNFVNLFDTNMFQTPQNILISIDACGKITQMINSCDEETVLLGLRLMKEYGCDLNIWINEIDMAKSIQNEMDRKSIEKIRCLISTIKD